MATFFGEIVNSASRAFWDEDDDFEDISETATNGSDFEIRHVKMFEGEPDIKLFVLVHGPLPTGFAEECLLKDTPIIAEIHETKPDSSRDDLSGMWKKSPKPSRVYQLPHSVVFCLCSPDLDVKLAHQFTEIIKHWTGISQKVMIVSSCFSTSYLTDGSNSGSVFLRELHTSKYTDQRHSEPLEQPNVIAGFPAGLLSWCEMFNIPSVLYVVYTDSNILDSITADPLIKLFTTIPITLNMTAKMLSKKSYDGPEAKSNLYI